MAFFPRGDDLEIESLRLVMVEAQASPSLIHITTTDSGDSVPQYYLGLDPSHTSSSFPFKPKPSLQSKDAKLPYSAETNGHHHHEGGFSISLHVIQLRAVTQTHPNQGVTKSLYSQTQQPFFDLQAKSALNGV